MKLRYFTIALTTAALLPTLAFAGDNMDAISASFDRDLNREFAVEYVPSAEAINDPLDAINVALRAEPDQVLASFERALYHEPVIVKTEVAWTDATPDPLDVINVAFRSEQSGILASFYRDLHRVPTTTTSVIMAGEPDPLDAINVALRNESIKLVEHVAIVESNRHVR